MKQIIYYVQDKNGVRKLRDCTQIGDKIFHQVEIKTAEKLNLVDLLENINRILNLAAALPATEIEIDKFYEIKEVLDIPLTNLNLEARSYDFLNSLNINTLGNIAKYKVSDLMLHPRFGKKILTDLTRVLEEKGLSFGMDVSKYGF